MYKAYGKLLFSEMTSCAAKREYGMVQNQQSKRGMRHVIMAVLAAVLVIGPSFVARIILDHSKIHIAYVALGSLAMFLVGAYLIITLLRE